MGEPEKWREFWFDKQAKTLYFVGKDNIPFHTIILPALLLASGQGYNLPWNVSATEFLQFKGQKASKSQRVGIWIDEALEMFPADYWRFFLIATRPESKDTNFTWTAFIDKINADLNDTFGNFIHRTLSFIAAKFDSTIPEPTKLDEDDQAILAAIKEKVEAAAQEIEASKLAIRSKHTDFNKPNRKPIPKRQRTVEPDENRQRKSRNHLLRRRPSG